VNSLNRECGVSPTGPAWKGWPLSVGQLEATGTLVDPARAHDAVRVWSGGKSHVTLHARAGEQSQRYEFVRQSGTIDLLPKATRVERVSWHGEPCSYHSVSFDEQVMERLLGSKIALPSAPLRAALTDAHVVDLVYRLHAQARAGQPLGASYVEGLSLTLGSYVFGKYGSRDATDPVAGALPTAYRVRLIALIDDQLARDLSLTELAAVVGYSPDHFARLFKRAFGVSPYQYVLERRIERAKSLLRQRSLSIADVAVRCGFASQAHLHLAFKARTGITPGAYRKS
jgi:AraC family transcriptional regulator